MALPENWSGLTPGQRLESRLDAWQNVPIEFASPEVAQTYRDRVQLYRDVIALKKPATVPIAPWIGLLPMRFAGYTGHDGYYDYKKLDEAWYKFHADYQPDGIGLTLGMVPGKLFDILDYKMYDLPGHGTSLDTSYQYNEKEWMRADEYDLLIQDPTDYWLRRYLPRMFGAMEPWSMLPAWTDLVEIPFTAPFFAGFSAPPVKEMLQKLMDAGDAAMEWLQVFMALDGRIMATLGIPQTAGGATKAPYDILGDTMRGTRGLMLDKFRQPDKVKAAMQRLVPQAVDWAVRSNNMTGNPLVFIPIHKGADGFMSDADYRELYWPTFKAVLLGLIEEGLVPMVFAEGGYNERLEVIADEEIPERSMIWMFDDTDMARAKAIVGRRQCIGGNVSAALFTMGTPEQMDAYVQELLGKTAADGGFILSSGIVLDEADPAAYKAFIDAGRKYGAEV
jgi:uroporphyrinogen-III decarboxylase